MSERTFIIILNTKNNAKSTRYVSRIGNSYWGKYSITTQHIDKAKIWKYKKSCENMVEKLNILPKNAKNKNIIDYSLKEITDLNIIRKIKLKKLNEL